MPARTTGSQRSFADRVQSAHLAFSAIGYPCSSRSIPPAARTRRRTIRLRLMPRCASIWRVPTHRACGMLRPHPSLAPTTSLSLTRALMLSFRPYARYTPANADGWYARNWQTGLGCAAEKLGLDQAEAFEFMASLWDEYSPDAALARSRIRLWTNSKIRTKSYLKALKRAYGHDAFLTCDGATGKRLSTVSICIDSSSKAVTRCPKKVLKQYKKRCPSKLRIERGNGSVKSVTPQCAAYY